MFNIRYNIVILVIIIGLNDVEGYANITCDDCIINNGTYEYDRESTLRFKCSVVGFPYSRFEIINMYWNLTDRNGKDRNLNNKKTPTHRREIYFSYVIGEKDDGSHLECIIPFRSKSDHSDEEQDKDMITFQYKPLATTSPATSTAGSGTTDTNGITDRKDDGKNTNQNDSSQNHMIIYIACFVFIVIILAIILTAISCSVKKKKAARSQNENISVHNATDRTRLAPKEHNKPEVNDTYSEVNDSMKQPVYSSPQYVYSDPYNIQNIPKYAKVIPKSERNKKTQDNVYSYANPSCSFTPRKEYVNIISDKSKYVNFDTDGRSDDYCYTYEAVQKNLKNRTDHSDDYL